MTGKSDFWSRRKAAVTAEQEAEGRAREEQAAAAAQAEMEARPEEEVLAELGLPDPDTLGPDDDFSGFMAAAVPDALRRRALRRLWRSNPVLANVDALVDYGEDYTATGGVLGAVQTAYRVGQGFKRHVDELAGPDPAAETAEEEQAAVPELSLAQDAPPEEPAALAPDTEEIAAVEQAAAPAPRRMRFTFES